MSQTLRMLLMLWMAKNNITTLTLTETEIHELQAIINKYEKD